MDQLRGMPKAEGFLYPEYGSWRRQAYRGLVHLLVIFNKVRRGWEVSRGFYVSGFLQFFKWIHWAESHRALYKEGDCWLSGLEGRVKYVADAQRSLQLCKDWEKPRQLQWQVRSGALLWFFLNKSTLVSPAEDARSRCLKNTCGLDGPSSIKYQASHSADGTYYVQSLGHFHLCPDLTLVHLLEYTKSHLGRSRSKGEDSGGGVHTRLTKQLSSKSEHYLKWQNY